MDSIGIGTNNIIPILAELMIESVSLFHTNLTENKQYPKWQSTSSIDEVEDYNPVYLLDVQKLFNVVVWWQITKLPMGSNFKQVDPVLHSKPDSFGMVLLANCESVC